MCAKDRIVRIMSQHGTRTFQRHCDVAIVGGSAAGLAAALQLARQRRSVIVIDAGEPRNAPAAHAHNYLGREGVPPLQLLEDGRAATDDHHVVRLVLTHVPEHERAVRD